MVPVPQPKSKSCSARSRARPLEDREQNHSSPNEPPVPVLELKVLGVVGALKRYGALVGAAGAYPLQRRVARPVQIGSRLGREGAAQAIAPPGIPDDGRSFGRTALTRSQGALLLGVVALGCFIHFFRIGASSWHLDELVYASVGYRFLHGDFTAVPGPHPYLGAYLLGLVPSVTGSMAPTAVRIAPAAAGVATGVVLFALRPSRRRVPGCSDRGGSVARAASRNGVGRRGGDGHQGRALRVVRSVHGAVHRPCVVCGMALERGGGLGVGPGHRVVCRALRSRRSSSALSCCCPWQASSSSIPGETGGAWFSSAPSPS